MSLRLAWEVNGAVMWSTVPHAPTVEVKRSLRADEFLVSVATEQRAPSRPDRRSHRKGLRKFGDRMTFAEAREAVVAERPDA